MTDEEVIEKMKNIIIEYSTQVEDYKCHTVPVRLDEDDIEAIETILNLVKIQKLQIKDLEKSVEEIYEDYQDVGKTMFEYSEEIEKKDKIIEEAISIIAALDTGLTVIREQFEKEYCEFSNSEEDCCWKDNDCTDCIRKYLEKKAKNN